MEKGIRTQQTGKRNGHDKIIIDVYKRQDQVFVAECCYALISAEFFVVDIIIVCGHFLLELL